jgi:predicted permease
MSILNAVTFAGWTRRVRRSLIPLGILVLSMTAAFVMLNVVDAVLVRALPYPESSDLVAITRLSKSGMKVVPDLSYGRWASVAADQASFSAYQTSNMTRSTTGGLDRVRVARATPSIFDVLRIRVSGGRPLRSEDAGRGAPPVAVVVGAGDQIGRTIVLDGDEYEVVGTLSDGIVLPNGTKPTVIVPMAVSSAPAAGRPVRFVNQIVARLNPGVSMATLTGRLGAVDAGIRDELPQPMISMWEGSTLSVTSLQEEATKDVRRSILALQAATAALLLIAALNVAALQMVVILGRQTEVGTRIALGASSLQIATGLVVESTGAVLMSGLVAVGLTTFVLRVLPNVLLWDRIAAGMPGWGASAVLGAGATVALVCVACAATTLLVLRLIYRRNPYASWRRVSVGIDARRLYGFLVAGQIAVAIVLAAGALLLLRTFVAVTHVERGFDPEDVLSANVSFQGPEFTHEQPLNAVTEDVIDTLRRTSGVSGVSLATTSPVLMPSSLVPVSARKSATPPAVQAGLDQVSPDYFSVARIPLLKGHVFASDDVVVGPKLAVISSALADQLFGKEDPTGQPLQVGDQAMTVVGVVGNVRSYASDAAPAARVYAWFAQQPSKTAVLMVRTAQGQGKDPTWIDEAVKSATARVVTYGSDRMGHSLAVLTASEHMRAGVALALALLAVFIAFAGVFGLASYYAMIRRRDVAIRVAIGALPSAIVRLQLFEGIKLGAVACGVALPISGALWIWMRPWLAARETIDFVALVWLAIGAIVAILLAFLPSAYRVSRLSPVAVLSEQ